MMRNLDSEAFLTIYFIKTCVLKSICPTEIDVLFLTFSTRAEKAVHEI